MAAAMEKNLFELKMAAKEMARTSKRAEKNEASERKKIKSCMTKGNMDGARIHAENAIREKSQALNYLKMAARLEGVSSRVQTAVTMNRVSGSMAGVVKGMGKAMKAMDLEKMSKMMDQFEKQFEDLDVKVGVMDGAMQSSSVASIPEGEVESLMTMVADEHGLELDQELGAQSVASASLSAQHAEEDDLTQRLAQLRGASIQDR